MSHAYIAHLGHDEYTYAGSGLYIWITTGTRLHEKEEDGRSRPRLERLYYYIVLDADSDERLSDGD